jgi:hypothetical protein
MKRGNCYNETTMIRTPDTGAAVAMAGRVMAAEQQHAEAD